MSPYTFHINLYDLALLGALFIGLSFAVLIWFTKTFANRFLSLALAVIVFEIARILGIDMGLSIYITDWSQLPLQFSLAFGPLIFFYVLKITRPEYKFQSRDLLHFSPLLLELGAHVLEVRDNIKTGAATYQTLTFQHLNPALHLLVCGSVIVYLYLSHRLIQDFYSRLRPVLMDRPRFAFRRLDRALLLIGLLCLLSLFCDIFILTLAFVLIGMAAEILLKSDNNAQLAMPITDRSDAKMKGLRLKEVVAANRLYEDAELTLTTLAVKLHIHPHDLSRIINMGLAKNFSDFINEFRVLEIARKIRNPAFDRLTLLGIAYESGFNSKTTFNRVFKEMTGKTPVEYKNSLKKEVPFDKMAPPSQMRPVLLRSESPLNWAYEKPKRKIMIRNYLMIAYRQLGKQKMYAAIKIGGFALGIAACLLIGLYIRDETNFDRSYPDADRIYRIYNNGTFYWGADWPAPMSKAIQKDLPEVEFSGHIMGNSAFSHSGNVELRRADQAQNTYEQGFIYADQPFLNAFQLPMVFGDGRTALKEPLTMVISKSMADKYYHGQNPIGQMMYLDNDKAHPYRISAVMDDIPTTSHLHQFNFLLTLAGMEFWPGEQNDWSSANYRIYVKLKAGVDPAAFEKKLKADMMNYWLSEFRRGGMKDAEKNVKGMAFHLQPVKDINLYSDKLQDGAPHGDIRFVWLFGAIGLFILVIACINFINLSTAKSANRAMEVGLRKVVGSNRSSLIKQFLTESLIYSLISFILGLVIAWLILPYFNALASKSLTMPWGEWWLLPFILISALLVGSVAGLYPALYLSSFRPAQVLKGSIANGSKSSLLRNGLVVFQFATSIILIISTIIIYSQTHFILNHKVGFDRDQVLILQGTSTLGDANIKTFKNELSKIASVKSASISDYLPINGGNHNSNTFFIPGREKLDPGAESQFWKIDETYLKTMGIKLVQGRNFSYDRSSDTAGKSVIINQTFAKALGLKNPIGQRISNGDTFTIIGVVQDFNFLSLRNPISPMVLRFSLSPSMMTIKFSGANTKNAIADVTALWKKYSPNQPIRFTFLDQEFALMYADVTRTGNIFTSFAVLAIIIACLGLFALSAFMAEQRTKEIGIRKVLGASVQGITTLLSMDFIKLVLIAIVIASPVAWWGMNTWLQDFTYRIPISWWMFVAAGIGAVLIALLTVSFQSVKVALANPVKSLRSE